jgi:CubicO group peptidase (beta-lactamase class C family)
MKHLFTAIILITATAAAANAQIAQPANAQTAATAQSDKATQIQRLLKENNLPGIQLIYTHDTQTEVYNLGTTGDSTHQITSNTVFEAASLSKCIFAYLVLRLYDRDQLDLDRPLLAYLGAYSRFDPRDHRYSQITARMVLHHTSGLPNWGDSDYARLRFPPDSCFSYSGEGYMFLQHTVEKITGKTLDELADQEVFTPLHMTSSSYTWQPRFDSVSAFGNKPDAIKEHLDPGAAFSLLTNAHDYTLFVKALSTGAGLKRSTWHLMMKPAVAATWRDDGRKEATEHIHWGLGVGLEDASSGTPSDGDRGPAFWHWGDNGAFKAYYVVYPRTHESLVYFVHQWRGLFITQQICDIFFGKQPQWGILWSGEGYQHPWNVQDFSTALDQQGFDKAARIHDQLAQKGDTLSEHDLNEYGSILMDLKRSRDAVAVFRLNLTLHPQSASAAKHIKELETSLPTQ